MTTARKLADRLSAALLNRLHWGDDELKRFIDAHGHEVVHTLRQEDGLRSERDSAVADLAHARKLLIDAESKLRVIGDVIAGGLAVVQGRAAPGP
jgi:hypothetical protein